MGLDVYAGSFTRYYAGDWETVVQKIAREQGMEVQVIRANETDEPRAGPEEIRPAVVAWREGMQQSLADHIKGVLDWDESDGAPYFTDKPAWDCYGSLLLWTAYAEHPELKRPQECIEDWTEDPAFQASNAEGFSSSFNQILRDVEIWLPHDFEFTFQAPEPNGNDVHIGSSVHLLAQLDDLNRRTWNASDATVAQWRHDGAEHLAPMEIGAQFAFSIMRALARDAVRHRLIMKLDY